MRKFAAIATPLALAVLLAGCGTKTSETTAVTENTVSNAASDTGDAISNTADDVKQAVTPTPSAQEFADTAAKSDAFEIASAKLAEKKAASADVKSFAAMMIKDHTASTAKIKAAAGTASPAITPNPALTDDQNDKLTKLGTLSGAEFDKEYASQQVDAHQSALSLMTGYSENGDLAAFKSAAAEIAPKVQAHLEKIKSIADKVG